MTKTKAKADKVLRPRFRNHAAAKLDRLTQDWVATNRDGNEEVRNDLFRVRNRARQLERDNPHARRFLSLLENNVVGSTGVRLQANPRDTNGAVDKGAKDDIERLWKEFCRKENFSITQEFNCWSGQKTVLRNVSRDGGIAVRRVRNNDTEFGYALDFLESDHIDHRFSKELPDGGTVRNGVQRNGIGRITGYWAFERHPGDVSFSHGGSVHGAGVHGHRRIFWDAKDYWVLQLPDRVRTNLSMTWLVSTMTSLNMLKGYHEAELVAARQHAHTLRYFTKTTPEGYDGPIDDQGFAINDSQPGDSEELPMGWDVKTETPTHPNTAYPEYVKAVLREIASGLGIDYNSLANDLEGVNFSSIRAGVLETRETYKMLQRWLIDSLMQPVYEEWLEQIILRGLVRFPMAKFTKFREVIWRPRRWAWVDPEKDIRAQKDAVNFGLLSKQRVIAESTGEDIEDVWDQIASDNQLQKDKKLIFNEEEKKQTTSTTEPVEPDTTAPGGDAGGAPGEGEDPANATSEGLNGAQITSSVEVIQQVTDGAIGPIAGTSLLVGVGFDPVVAAAMIAEAVAFEPTVLETPPPAEPPPQQNTSQEPENGATN